MLSRRNLLGMVTAAGVLTAARPAIACETDEPIKDAWGPKLTDFFRTGDPSIFDGQLRQDVSLVSFERYYTGSDKLAFEGPAEVTAALLALREFLTKDAWGSPRVFKTAKLSGQLYAATTNKLSLTFATTTEIRTSCGLTTSPNEVDLLYVSDFEPESGKSLPALTRLAVLSPTYPSDWFKA